MILACDGVNPRTLTLCCLKPFCRSFARSPRCARPASKASERAPGEDSGKAERAALAVTRNQRSYHSALAPPSRSVHYGAVPPDLQIECGLRTSANISADSGHAPLETRRFFDRGEKTPRAGLYARVSTHDQQTLPMEAAMRDYARKCGWQITLEVEDGGSGATLRQKREDLRVGARSREIRSCRRMAPGSLGRSFVDLVNTLQELSSLNVGSFH
jgi:hypothetical protein